MEIVNKNIEEIKMYENNPRIMTVQLSMLLIQ